LNREPSPDRDGPRIGGGGGVGSFSQQLNSIINASTQVAQTVMSDLLSSPKTHQPKIDANLILDNFLMDLKQSLLKSSGGDGISLPDMRTSGSGGVAVHLTQGRLSGMANWSRWGDAKLETKCDRVQLSFTVIAKDLLATYTWSKNKMRGEMAAGLSRTTLQMKLEQKLNSQSDLTELLVGNPGSIHIGLNGLGPLNWLGKKLVLRHIRENIHDVVEEKAKEIITAQLRHFSLVDQISIVLLNF